MAFTSIDDIGTGLAATDRQIMNWSKASITSQVAGTYCSLWRATGTPAQAAIPAAVTICDKTTVGAWNFVSPNTAAGEALYIAKAKWIVGNGGTGFELHDRLVHMGGLSGIVTTVQTVALVVNGSTSNLPNRLGKADLSELQWWLECYTNLGATGVNFTIAVTYTDASTGNIVLAPGANFAASRVLPVLSAHASGLPIQSIDNVTLSATTGTAGSFGFTVTRELTSFESVQANAARNYIWSETEMTNILESTCICGYTMCSTTGSGSIVGSIKVIHV
jgi:hypothetical protein